MADEFVDKLKAEAEQERITGRAAGKDKTKGGVSDLSHGRSGDTMKLNPYRVTIRPGWNIRDPSKPHNKARIVEYAEDIKKRGQLDAVEIAWSKGDKEPYVVDGHTRVLAIRYAIEKLGAKIETVTCVTGGVQKSEIEQMSRMFAPGAQAPTTLEKAAHARKMVTLFGLSVQQLSERIHVAAPVIQGWMDQEAMLSEPIRQMVEAGTVSISLACQIIRENNHDTDAALADLKAAVDGAGGKKVRPRMVRQAQAATAQRMPSLRSVVRDLLSDLGTAKPAAVAGYVTLTMSDEQYAALRAHAKIKDTAE